jgi:hypothetical protein
MEYCSLDDAFPASMTASPGCRDSKSVKEQARTERRRARKCKGPQSDYLADPDRPSLSSAPEEGEVMRGSGVAVNPYNSSTGLFENGPLGRDQIIGASIGGDARLPNGQAVDELLVKAPQSAYTERKAPPSTVNTMLMETSGPARLTPSGAKVPAYFGADLDDEVEGFQNSPLISSLSHDQAASFTPMTNNKNEFMMSSDFTQLFAGRGADKAAGPALPVPSVVDSWKRMTPSGAQSAYIDALPPPGGEYVIGSRNQSESPSYEGNKDLMRRLDKIFARLDDLETSRLAGGESNHMEIFMFILSGMFVMFAMDALAKRR